MRSLLWYQKSYDLLEDYFTKHNLSRKEVTLYDGFIDYLKNRSSLSSDELEEIQLLAMNLLIQEKVVFTEEEGMEFLNAEYDVHLLHSFFFHRRGQWYHFIHPNIQYFLCLQLYQRFSSIGSLRQLIQLFEKNVKNWVKIGYYIESSSCLYPVIESLFPRRWMDLVVKRFTEFLNSIKKKDEVTIATSMLLPFQLQYHYHWDGSCNGNYYNTFLYDLIDIYFGVDVASYFDYIDEDNSLQHFLDQFVGEKEGFFVNDYVNRKTFKKLLIENGIVDELNKLYQQINDFVLSHTLIESGNKNEG